MWTEKEKRSDNEFLTGRMYMHQKRSGGNFNREKKLEIRKLYESETKKE